jgi:hypothetical protein
MVAIPVIIVLLVVLFIITDTDESLWIGVVLLLALGTSIFMYVIARLVLIILPLVALRSLPSSALMDVSWSTYIPHL